MTDKIAQVTSLLLLIRGEFKRSHRIWGSHLAHLGQQSHLARNEARRFARGWAPCSHRELRQPIFPGTMRSPVIRSSGLEHLGQTQSFSVATIAGTWGETKNRSQTISLTSQQMYVKGQLRTTARRRRLHPKTPPSYPVGEAGMDGAPPRLSVKGRSVAVSPWSPFSILIVP